MRSVRPAAPQLAGLEPYDPKYLPACALLSANENPRDVGEKLRREIMREVARVPLNRYPDPMSGALRNELARWHGVDRACVCVGNGGDELLYNFLLAFGGPGRTLVTCPPDFSEYAFFASLAQTEVARVWRDPATFEIDAPALLEAARTAQLVILTSPNNPTGNLVSAELVERVCAACPGLVMVDEAYGEFAPAGTSAAPLLERCPNLVVLHTLSKAFGEAGIRCGYVLAAPDVVEVFAAIRQIYSVNVLTQAAATAAVRNRASFGRVVEQICSERERLLAALRAPRFAAAGLEVWPSAGNFVLARMPRASQVRARLRDEYSILVRDFSYVPGLDGCLRITVGTPDENNAVLAALAELTGAA